MDAHVQIPAKPHTAIGHLTFRYQHLCDLFDEAIDLAMKQGPLGVAITSLLKNGSHHFGLWADSLSIPVPTRIGSTRDVLSVIENFSQDSKLLLNIHEQFNKLARILLSYLDWATSQIVIRLDDNDPTYKETLENLQGFSLCFGGFGQLSGRIRAEYSAALEGKAKASRQSVVLCFSVLYGGGIRSYSSLLILKALMFEVTSLSIGSEPEIGGKGGTQLARTRDYFDYIFGSSSGGLSAIMLGRLRMDVNDCIKQFETYVTDVFGEGPRCLIYPFVREKYRGENLEKAIHKVINDIQPDSNQQSWERDQFFNLIDKCKTAVIARETRGSGRLYLFRTYFHPPSNSSCGINHGVPIWQVARATSAAPTYFNPISINKKTFIDGGMGSNNLSMVACKEVESMDEYLKTFQKQPNYQSGPQIQSLGIGIMVSIGSGKSRISEKSYGKESVTHEDVARQLKGATYFRLNVDNGLQDIRFDECEMRVVGGKRINVTLDKIRAATETYLAKPEVVALIRNCAKELVVRRRPHI